MNRTVLCLSLAVAFVAAGAAAAQTQSAEGAIRLVVRADDIGSSHTAHPACIRRAFTSARVKEMIEKKGIQLCSYRDIWSD